MHKDSFFTEQLYCFADFLPNKPISNRQVAIVHYCVDAPELNSADNELLQKIMQAVGIDLDKEVMLINLAFAHPPIGSLPRAGVSKLLSFGASMAQAGLNLQIANYLITRFYGMTLLFADALGTIANDKQLKMLLWQKLKKMFEENENTVKSQ